MRKTWTILHQISFCGCSCAGQTEKSVERHANGLLKIWLHWGAQVTQLISAKISATLRDREAFEGTLIPIVVFSFDYQLFLRF
jgi:hypothetical protein